MSVINLVAAALQVVLDISMKFSNWLQKSCLVAQWLDLWIGMQKAAGLNLIVGQFASGRV